MIVMAPDKKDLALDHWRVILEGYGKRDAGYVVTKDGEIIGTWASDENDICSFTPEGDQEPLITDAFLGPFCNRIAEWHEGRQ